MCNHKRVLRIQQDVAIFEQNKMAHVTVGLSWVRSHNDRSASKRYERCNILTHTTP